jgi:hypothetical protein
LAQYCTQYAEAFAEFKQHSDNSDAAAEFANDATHELFTIELILASMYAVE